MSTNEHINELLAKENISLKKENERLFELKKQSAKYHFEERSRRQELEAQVCNLDRIIRQSESPVKIGFKNGDLYIEIDKKKSFAKNLIEILKKT